MPIPPDIRTEILYRLQEVEREHDVRILMAIESGSRAWGFASPNSDFDVRFIYAHPRDHYLRIDHPERRDVIEKGVSEDIDLNGWDLRKALRLFWKSNPVFIEWVQSPIRYREIDGFASDLLAAIPQVFSPEKGSYHYRSMAKTNLRTYLDQPQVPIKKYFYVLRPLLCVRWIERFGSAPPMEFRNLLPLLEDAALLSAIERLLEQKAATRELGLADPIPEVDQFVREELARLEAESPEKDELRDSRSAADLLSGLFLKYVEAGRAD